MSHAVGAIEYLTPNFREMQPPRPYCNMSAVDPFATHFQHAKYVPNMLLGLSFQVVRHFFDDDIFRRGKPHVKIATPRDANPALESNAIELGIRRNDHVDF